MFLRLPQVTITPELVPFLGRVRFARRRTNETEQAKGEKERGGADRRVFLLPDSLLQRGTGVT